MAVMGTHGITTLLSSLLLLLFTESAGIVFDLNDLTTSETVTAIIEIKKSTTSIRLQSATPRDLYNKFVSSRKINIKNSDLSGTPISTMTDQYVGLTFDYHKNMYYVINRKKYGDASIWGFYASGDNLEPVLIYKGLSSTVQSLAMDWINDMLYWADPTNGVITRTPMEPRCLSQSSAEGIVGGLDKPLSLAVHPKRGYVFWTNGGSSRTIERSDLAGRSRTYVVYNLRDPRAITIDYDNDRIYWIDNRGYNCILESADLDGNSRLLLENVRDSNVFDLDILQGYIIATDVKKNRVYLYNVESKDLTFKDWIGKPMGVKVYAQQRQHYPPDPMNKNITHFQFMMDKGKIFLGSERGIYMMDRRYPGRRSTERIVRFLARNMTTAITSDAHKQYLYFYEDELKSIQRIKLQMIGNQTVSELVSLAVGKADGLAVDWVAGNIYWSDSRYKQIMVARSDGRYQHVLASEAVEKPRSLAVHPIKRFVFWCDIDPGFPRIERCDLDGRRRQSIVTGNKARTPRALAIDFKDDRLYWTDGMIIHYGKLNGSGQFCLHSSGRSTVRALVVFNDFIIWSDVLGRLHTAHKEYSKSQQQLPGSTVSFVDLVYHDHESQPLTYNPCATNNGNCDQLCLPSQVGHTCVCTLGYWNYTEECVTGVVGDRFLIFVDQRQGGIYQRPLFIDEYYAVPLQMVKQPRDVVYDSRKKLIYWSDIAAGTISRSMLNGSNQEIIYYQSHRMPYTLNLDAASQLLYFVDLSKNIVVAINLKNLLIYTVVPRNESLMIQDVALDPQKGMMYISCNHMRKSSGKSMRSIGAIYSATMLGTNMKPIADYLGTPKGITLLGQELIWVDPKRNAIEGLSLANGTKYTLKRLFKKTQIHDITVADGYIYWTELTARAIKRSPLDNLTATETYGQENFYRVPGLDSYTGGNVNDTVCTKARCRYMCIPTPTGARCVRPDNKRRGYINYKNKEFSEFCLTEFIENGRLIGNEPYNYVPVGYRLHFICDVGYRIEWLEIARNNRDGYVVCNIGGEWNRKAECSWALPYTIQGNNRIGYTFLHDSTPFLVPPGIEMVNVICIGGGGGGYDSNSADMRHTVVAGNGQNSMFGDNLIAMGGQGGSFSAGGRGGIGTVFFGGDGGDANHCNYGGAAGQYPDQTKCKAPSTFCTFCGAGGRKAKCPSCPGNTTGGCSGPLSPSDASVAGSHYGGGASGGNGGGGGGGGFSRMNINVDPGDVIDVIVGKGGVPSFASAGDGLVVISWGSSIETIMEEKIESYFDSISYC